MSSTFYGLQIAKTGLHASQLAMELTGHNVANANTKGYTRQVLHQSSIEGLSTQGIVASGQKIHIGGGVEVNYIDQVRNEFLDIQYRRENSALGDWEIKSDAFYYIENVFNEPSDSGISTVLNEFYASLSSLSTDPSSEEIRNLLRQNAISVTETFNYYANQLSELQDEQDNAIATCVDEINTKAQQIADLNKQIVKYERSGEQANDLYDRRNLLIDEMSKLVDISYEYNDRNEVSIYMGKESGDKATRDNYCLVDANDANAVYTMTAVEDKAGYYVESGTKMYTVTLNSKGGSVEINGSSLKGGDLKGYFDLRDGNTNDNIGIPYFMQKLDTLAKGIVNAYNEAHKQGYTIPLDDSNVSNTGINFFEDFGDMSKVTAWNMDISQDVKDSVWNIAASDKQVDMTANNTQEGNNAISLKMEAIANSTTLDGIENIGNFLAGIISELGVRADQCNDMYESQELIVDNVDDLRMSVSGVSIDEEVANLITFQRAYQASSRVLTSIDEMLDKLINGTGRVGL